jgi:arylsulfatase A-like enzyme
LIIFSSDNGGPNPGKLTSNGPLRAGKATIYDGGVKVCAFANWPGQIKSNTVVNAPLHIVDWYPTLLKLAGASLEQKLALDGRDLWPALTTGASSPHDSILINASPRKGALRAGDWKLVINGDATEPGDGDDEADQAPQEKEPQKTTADTIELFNLADDPGETNNIAAMHRVKVRELRARYDALAKQQVPPKARPKAKGFVSPKIWGESD